MLVRNGLTKSLIVLEEYLPWTEPKTPKLRFCYLGCFALLINSCAPASAADRDQGDDQARRDRDPHAQEIPGPMDIELIPAPDVGTTLQKRPKRIKSGVMVRNGITTQSRRDLHGFFDARDDNPAQLNVPIMGTFVNE
jgi:hypothetical protein